MSAAIHHPAYGALLRLNTFRYAIVLLTTLNRRQDYRSATSDQSEFTEFGIRMSRLARLTVTETGIRPPQAPAALVVKLDHAMAMDDPCGDALAPKREVPNYRAFPDQEGVDDGATSRICHS